LTAHAPTKWVQVTPGDARSGKPNGSALPLRGQGQWPKFQTTGVQTMEFFLCVVTTLDSTLNKNHAVSGRAVQTLPLNIAFDYYF
jgi:hypothetical protein